MTQNPSRVMIISYGEMGHAMAHFLGGKHQMSVYDIRSAQGLPPINVEQEAALADFVLLCVPAAPIMTCWHGSPRICKAIAFVSASPKVLMSKAGHRHKYTNRHSAGGSHIVCSMAR